MLPPFTDLRSVQTLVDGDKLAPPVRRPGPVARTTPAPTPARSPARSWPSSAAPTSSSGTASGASTTHEDDAVVNAKVKAALPARARRRSSASARASRSARRAGTSSTCSAQLDAALDGVAGRAGPQPRRRLRAGLGDRHRRGRHARGRAGGLRRDPHPLAELYSGDLADGVRVLYGGSVKAGNVAAIMAQTDVDGALVGGASIDAEEFAVDLPLPRARDRRLTGRPRPRAGARHARRHPGRGRRALGPRP